MTHEGRAMSRGVPFMQTIGVPVAEVLADAASVRLPWRADLGNSAGALHGGALMSTLDYAMSQAARGTDTALRGVSTVDMRTSFLRAIEGDALVSARCIRRGRSLAFCEARAHDDGGAVVATASATFKLIRAHGVEPNSAAPASRQENR